MAFVENMLMCEKLSPEVWYSRRGYETYKEVPAMWFDGDKKGKLWPIAAVFMRKEIKS